LIGSDDVVSPAFRLVAHQVGKESLIPPYRLMQARPDFGELSMLGVDEDVVFHPRNDARNDEDE
jgi:hypothetical protein